MGEGKGRAFSAGTVVLVALAVALAASGLTYVLLIWLSGADSPPSIDARPTAAFIGDSYTVGGGSSRPERRWTTLVAEAEGWNESNFGELGSGYLTQGFGGTSYLQRVESVIAARPDVVVLAGGQNDIGTTGDIEAATWATLTLLRQGLPTAELYVVGPTWPEQQPPERLVEIEKAAADAAADVDAQFIPALSWIAGRPELMAPDKIHPNDEGHEVIADKVVAALRPPPTAARPRGVGGVGRWGGG